MNEIHFIKNLHFDEGLWCNSFGKADKPFMRQGDLDGACAVYSLMMMLVLHQKVKRCDLVNRESKPGYTANKRLQDQFLSGLIGLYRGGYDFQTLRDELHSCFKSKATATVYTTDKDIEGNVTKDELNRIIMKTIDAGNPVEVGFMYKGYDGGHAVVAVGYQLFKGRMILYCFDPAFELPFTSFWNSVIDVDLEVDGRMKWTAGYIEPSGNINVVNVDEILVID